MKIERQLQGTLNTVFTELIKERGLENRIHPYAPQEENRADITLKNKNGKTIFFIELKDPTARDGKSVFDGNILMREAGRAQKADLQYFGNCNFLACGFFDVTKFYENVSINEGFFTIADIVRLSNNYSPSKDVLGKLRKIAEFYLERAIEVLDRKPIQFSPIDELFIFKIRKLIEVYAPAISNKVWEKYNKNKDFEREIQKYTQSQLWNKPSTLEEIEKLTHISILMLISKLIFYKTYVDNQTFHSLHPMRVSPDIVNPNELEIEIWKYFEEFKDVTGDFELLIGERTDIIFQIPFVSIAVIDLVNDILDTEHQYNFGKIPFDIIGRIFEELIREDERHKLGQYFTPPDVIDLINVFAIKNCNDKILDPSCGSGTFLVRAYERKKNLCKENDKGANHEVMLKEIYGNDLSGYPAYLSMLNLAIRNTRRPSYPRIINKDFFAITESTAVSIHQPGGELTKKPLPKFDAIIGNPPYTRQEDIGTMNGTQTKDKIAKLIKSETQLTPSKRTSIYAYFFYHAGIFLKNGGHLAYIVQNSWLETDYGADLQKYMLANYEIIAIIESEVERFFPSASVNTNIVILRKQKDEDARNKNSVRFIYLIEPLSDIIKSHKGVENLYKRIINSSSNVSTKAYKINCIAQPELHTQSKWSIYLKAPKIYFDIIEKGKNKFKPLITYAEIKRGITTGANDFFIVEDITQKSIDDHLIAAVNNTNFTKLSDVKAEGLKLVVNGQNEVWLIESQFLKPILTSPKDVNTYTVKANSLKNMVLMVHHEKRELKSSYPYIFRYIQHAEKQNIHNRSTVASRKRWYDLGERKLSDMAFSYMINDFGKTFACSTYTNDNLHNIFLKTKKGASLHLYLNSTLSWLIQQLTIRSNFGDGVGKIQTYELENFPVITMNFDKDRIDIGRTNNYKEELGSLDTIKTVNPERRKLDEAILREIGYRDKEERETVLLELYKATYQLIDARLKKAQSLKTVKVQRNKVAFSVYIDQLKNMLIENKVPGKNTITFAKEVQRYVKQITSEGKLQKKIFDTYWKERFGEAYDEKRIIDDMQGKIF